MGNFLRLTSRKTKVLDLGDGGELVVRTDVSKGSFRALLARLPEDLTTENTSFSPLEQDDFTTGLFEVFVTGWNAVDEDDRPVKATVDNYLELPRDVASVIDQALMEHFNSITVSEEDKSDSEAVGGGDGEVQSGQLPEDGS